MTPERTAGAPADKEEASTCPQQPASEALAPGRVPGAACPTAEEGGRRLKIHGLRPSKRLGRPQALWRTSKSSLVYKHRDGRAKPDPQTAHMWGQQTRAPMAAHTLRPGCAHLSQSRRTECWMAPVALSEQALKRNRGNSSRSCPLRVLPWGQRSALPSALPSPSEPWPGPAQGLRVCTLSLPSLPVQTQKPHPLGNKNRTTQGMVAGARGNTGGAAHSPHARQPTSSAC